MRLAEQLFRILAPNTCIICKEEGVLLCSWCVDDALPGVIERCYRCNKLSAFSATCVPCRRNTPLKHVWVRSEYSDAAKELVHRMKFKYSGEAADVIAKQLVNTLPALPPSTIVVHVPTATGHVRERGFDHAQRMASRMSASTGIPHLPLLARTSQKRQVGSTRRQRLEQMGDAFRPRFPELICGARVLLIDDVLTTGATIEAAAKTLKQAGAKSIDAVIFAHAK